MTAPTQDPYRKLAEEIGKAIAKGVHSMLRACVLEGYSQEALEHNITASSDHWEARLRSALPELSQVLGELAVAREALISARERTSRRVAPWGYSDSDAELFYSDRDAEVARLDAALSSDSGRLAAELIRAAVHERQGEVAGAIGASLTSERQERVDALLSAFPGLRGEVER